MWTILEPLLDFAGIKLGATLSWAWMDTPDLNEINQWMMLLRPLRSIFPQWIIICSWSPGGWLFALLTTITAISSFQFLLFPSCCRYVLLTIASEESRSTKKMAKLFVWYPFYPLGIANSTDTKDRLSLFPWLIPSLLLCYSILPFIGLLLIGLLCQFIFCSRHLFPL